ncbi:MAG: hypothetical protein D6698_04980 [Gammaproteobacteria bacterium]|nr:MAG: hypothetical protein D6698_04980 [Gammaproteobacteria bacterium]
MCHIISPPNDVFFLEFFKKEMLVGQKSFETKPFRPLIVRSKYVFSQTEFGLETNTTLSRQELDFKVPSLNEEREITERCIRYSGFINAGYHVTPFFADNDSESFLKNALAYLTKTNPESVSFLCIPVLFLVDHILFGDGQHVSVSKFTIMKPKILSMILDQYENSDEQELYAQHYEKEIWPWIMKNVCEKHEMQKM